MAYETWLRVHAERAEHPMHKQSLLGAAEEIEALRDCLRSIESQGIATTDPNLVAIPGHLMVAADLVLTGRSLTSDKRQGGLGGRHS